MSRSRQLAAIMFTDIVGYTKLMGEDEEKAFELLKKNRSVQRPIIERYNGRWLKEIGDGVLASFNAVSDAVYCAGTIQKTCENDPDLKLRIGIHEGEVVFEGDDVFGDGVNIASRLEPLAPIGGILVSEAVHKNVLNKKGIESTFVREEQLRNVREPVRVYQVQVEKDEPPENPPTRLERPPRLTGRKGVIVSAVVIILLLLGYAGYQYRSNEPQTYPPAAAEAEIDKSIAVIPFKNLSSEEDSQYFSDGMLDAILSNLSNIGELRVISRTSTEQYRDSPKSIPIIANELDVEHILEGSVQRDGDKVRIIVQLIDASLDEHIWSETYDEELKAVFEVQSDIARQIAAALQAELSSSEKEVIENIPTENQVAYDFYLKGEDYISRAWGNENDDALNAIKMYKRAVDSDPNFTLAWVGLAKASRRSYHFHISMEHLLKTKEYLDQAIALEPDLMEVQVETAMYYYHCEINYQKSLDILEKLKNQYPKNERIFFAISHIYRRMGELETALDLQKHTISLSPFNWQGWSSTAQTLTMLRRYSEAESYINKAIELNPSYGYNYTRLALLFLITGELDKAKSLISDNQEVSNEIKSYTELLNRNFQKAIDIVNSSSESAIGDQYKFVPKPLQLGLIYYCIPNKEVAEIYFQESINILSDTLTEFQNDARIYSALGIAYAGVGKNELAISYGQKALSIMNYSVDVIRGFYRELDMAKIQLMNGNYREAISKLKFLIEQNGYLSVELLKRDPFWDPLREMEDFENLIRNPKYVNN